jgi:ATP-dependent DNA helicase RecQ
VTHLIDVLLGKVTPRVKQYFHEQVSTFGIGTELNQARWNSIYRQLVAGGYLDADIELHGGLKLVDDIALPVLRGEQEVWLRKETGYSKSKATKSGARKGSTHPFSNIADEKLWEALKAQRTELAREQGVPPYVIFHDSTLLEMVKSTPTTLDQFSHISGVGQAKLDRYGKYFIEVILEHLEAN